MGDTNLRQNEIVHTKNIKDTVIEYNLLKYYTINKYINKYFIKDYIYVCRYDRIYSNNIIIINYSLAFNIPNQLLINEYRQSGYISDHFGLYTTIYI